MQHFDSNPLHIVSNLQRRLDLRAATDVQVWSAERMHPVNMYRGVRIVGVRYCVNTWYADWRQQAPQINAQVKVAVAMELFRSQFLEDKFSAIVFVGEILIAEHVINTSHMRQFANLIDTSCISGYEVCDRFSTLVLKQLLIVHRHETMPIMAEWMRCQSSWRARSAVWALIPLARDAIYENLIIDGCAIVLGKSEECCKLAVGSALRALARTSPGVVYEFLNEDHNLLRMSAHGLSRACGDHNDWKLVFREKRKDLLRSRRVNQAVAAAVENGGAGASSSSAPVETEAVAVSLPVTTAMVGAQAGVGVSANERSLPSISELIGMRQLERASSVSVAALTQDARPQEGTDGETESHDVGVEQNGER